MTEVKELQAEIVPQDYRVEVPIIAPEKATIPTYGTPECNGADLYAYCPDGPITIRPGETVAVPTGLKMEIPANTAGLIFPRSGLSSKTQLRIANSVGVVDSDYRGEIKVLLQNTAEKVYLSGSTAVPPTYTIEHGDRIAQILFVYAPQVKFIPTEELSETKRGVGGFGSTGK